MILAVPLPSCRKVEGSNPSTNTQRDSVAVHVHAISHIGQSLLSNGTGRSNDRVTLTLFFSEARTCGALGGVWSQVHMIDHQMKKFASTGMIRRVS